MSNSTFMEKQFRIYAHNLSKNRKELKLPNRLLEIRKRFLDKEISFYEFIESMHSYNMTLFSFSDFLKDTEIEEISIKDGHVIFTTKADKIKLLFNSPDKRNVPFEMLNFGTYEIEEREIINKLLADGMNILDIGANIGWYSLLWAKSFSKSKIYAYEPVKELALSFKENIKLNKLNNIELFESALSDSNEPIQKFNFYRESTGLSSFANLMDYQDSEEIEVKNQTLDSSIGTLGLKSVDFIKCDVEGAELKVILGGLRTIKEYKPLIVIELYHEWTKNFCYHPDELLNILKDLGYCFFLPKNGFLEEVGEYQGEDFERQNYFLLHSTKHKKIISSIVKVD